MKSKVEKSVLNGIHYVISTVASNKYVVVIHEKSKLPIARFTDTPVKDVALLIKKCDEILFECDWTLSKNKMNSRHETVAFSLKYSIRRNKEGLYTTNPLEFG